jgi:hypothetical protein
MEAVRMARVVWLAPESSVVPNAVACFTERLMQSANFV